MKYELKGSTLPVLICHLDAGEKIVCENGAMSWMSSNLQLETKSGGVSKSMMRLISGEGLFEQVYTAKGEPGFIAFASSFPGNILAIELSGGKEVICQKNAYLASTPGITKSIHFQKKFGSGLFGGEGFIMQKFSGEGIVFIEIDGSTVEYELARGEELVVDTGYLAMMDATCTMDIVPVAGIKNKLLGGDGLFNTVISGPGKVLVQTMPASAIASAVAPYISTGGN